MILFSSLFSSSLGQDLLDCLLFFQKEGTHDAFLHTVGASRTSVSTRDSTFSLLGSVVFAGSNVLDSRKHTFAVTADGSLGLLVNSLCL